MINYYKYYNKLPELLYIYIYIYIGRDILPKMKHCKAKKVL